MITLDKAQQTEQNKLNFRPFFDISFELPDVYDTNEILLQKPNLGKTKLVKIGTLYQQLEKIYNDLKFNNINLTFQLTKEEIETTKKYIDYYEMQNPPVGKIYLGYITTDGIRLNLIFSGVLKKEYKVLFAKNKNNIIQLVLYGGLYGTSLKTIQESDRNYLENFRTLNIFTIMNYFNLEYNIPVNTLHNFTSRLDTFDTNWMDIIRLKSNIIKLVFVQDSNLNDRLNIVFVNDIIYYNAIKQIGNGTKSIVGYIDVKNNMLDLSYVVTTDTPTPVSTIRAMKKNYLGEDKYNMIFLSWDDSINLQNKYIGIFNDKLFSKKYINEDTHSGTPFVSDIAGDINDNYLVILTKPSNIHSFYLYNADTGFIREYSFGDTTRWAYLFTIDVNDFLLIYTSGTGTGPGDIVLKIQRLTADGTITFQSNVQDNNESGYKILTRITINRVNDILNIRFTYLYNNEIHKFTFNLSSNSLSVIAIENNPYFTDWLGLSMSHCIIKNDKDTYYFRGFNSAENRIGMYKYTNGTIIELIQENLIDYNNDTSSSEYNVTPGVSLYSQHTEKNELLTTTKDGGTEFDSSIFLYGKVYSSFVRTDIFKIYKNIYSLYKDFSLQCNAYFSFLQDKLVFTPKEISIIKDSFSEDEIYQFENKDKYFTITKDIIYNIRNIINHIIIKYNNNKKSFEEQNIQSITKYGLRPKSLILQSAYNIEDLKFVSKMILNFYSLATLSIKFTTKYFPNIELGDIFSYDNKIWQVISIRQKINNYQTIFDMIFTGIEHSIWGASVWGEDTWG